MLFWTINAAFLINGYQALDVGPTEVLSLLRFDLASCRLESGNSPSWNTAGESSYGIFHSDICEKRIVYISIAHHKPAANARGKVCVIGQQPLVAEVVHR